ncbi:DUF58 domain-containing protein [Snodgrassella sp. CFCC 13594]|uniref:DUF58 domain-containing protein n=1 Tax=Snodgrassella sp. CFCC 13594 TaxID=1775559 RepID=UPI00082FA1D9|nr:DUF58 domain-containing protein [Snodgrassella sp. CFCC 13594]
MVPILKPTKRLLWLWTMVCAATAVLLLWPGLDNALLRYGVMVVAGFLLVLVLADALRSPNLGQINWQRQLPSQLIQGQPARITLTLQLGQSPYWRRSRQLVVVDRFPEFWSSESACQTVQTRPGMKMQISYDATPHQRGLAVFGAIEYWIPSFLGFWLQRHWFSGSQSIKVLPDFSRILGEQFIGLQKWLQWVGAKPMRHQGQGSTFHQLREYRDGDDIRHIDWKASDRLNRMVVRSYAQEQDHQVVFLLDCGRNMRALSAGFSHFDHALQAMLMLSYTALKQGDAVGLHTFAHDEPRHVAPRKNLMQLGHLVQGIYDVMPSSHAPDWGQVVDAVLHMQQRRSLVVVLTQLQASDETELTRQLKRLQNRHHVVLASLLPADQNHVLVQPVAHTQQADRYFAAWRQQQQLDKLIQVLSAQKLGVVYASTQALSSRLINRYLAWRIR